MSRVIESTPRRTVRAMLCASLLAAIALLVSAQTMTDAERLEVLGGAERASTHITLDKPIYRPGETLYMRALLVDALTRQPVHAANWQTPIPDNYWQTIEIISPKGSKAYTASSHVKDSVAAMQWDIPRGIEGGQYTLKVTNPHSGLAPAERKFEIRAYRPPRLRTQIEFLREGYGPGDEVVAILDAKRAEGGVPADAAVEIIARVDEAETWRANATIGDDGLLEARFRLPETIVYGNGVLTFVIADGGVMETAAKTIPILLSRIDLRVYPEGGYLVAGLENRVYFEATAPNGRPADIVAELVDDLGSGVTQTSSEHEGRGSFTFIPEAGKRYRLRVLEPWTVTTEVELDEAVDGVLIKSLDDVTEPGAPLRVLVSAASRRQVLLSVNTREKEHARRMVSLGLPGDEDVVLSIDLPAEAEGVLRVTAFDLEAGNMPVAERLVFRRPAKSLRIEVTPAKDAYVPADTVTLDVKVTDGAGNPVKGFVGLVVTDDATLEMIEDREKPPRLPVQVFLEDNVRELADAHVYLSDDPQAPRALDLLLGTQGWRRFVFIEPHTFLEQHGDAARRVLAQRVAPIYTRDRMWLARGAPVMLGQEVVELQAVEKMVEADAFADDKAGLGVFVADEPGEMGAFAILEPARLPAAAVAGILEIDGDLDMADNRERFEGARYAYSASPPTAYPREYAFKARADRSPDDRSDFTETVYWNAALKTDDKGAAAVTFDLSDSVTTFRVLADGWTADGVFGAGDAVVESRRPFYIEVKAPLEVSSGDRILLPVSLVNDTDKEMTAALTLSASAGLVFDEYPDSIVLPANSRRRLVVPAKVGTEIGGLEITASAGTGEFTDHVTRTIPARPVGFPVAIHRGGMLDNNVTHRIAIPDSLTGPVVAAVEVYPKPIGNLTSALESMIRDPHGCFEQTSSTNYPLVMAMQYFETHSGVSPELVRRSREKLDAGYNRLVGFESPAKGYEWFGGDPGHEALTAYGLLEFADMSEIYTVDASMVQRTRAWLLERRDGNGGFLRNEKALDSFGRAPDAVTNAYIVWALAVSGERDIEEELDAALVAANDSGDPYLLALTAGALTHAGRDTDASPLRKRLAGAQADDGSIPGAETSVTRSGGNGLLTETTSLAVLAWLGDSAHAPDTEKAMRWLAGQCQGGSFGSTQATVLALKAIVEYDKVRAKEMRDGEVTLLVDGRTVGTLAYTGETQDTLRWDDFAPLLRPGEHAIELRQKDGSPVPYSIAVGYHAVKPESAVDSPLAWDVQLAASSTGEGEALEVIATLANTTAEGLPMTLAVVGLPGGLEPRHDQLKELVQEGVIDFYEVIGRDVALYLRDMAPNEEKRIVLSTIAAIPGEWTGSASRANLYYTPETRLWTEGLKVTIGAK